MPTVLGATNWAPPSYSPKTGLFYVSAWENTDMAVEGQSARRGVAGTGSTPMGQATLAPNIKKEEEGYGVVRALDPNTLEKKWEFKMNDITWARRPHHGGRSGLQRRQGRLLLRARRPNRRAALEASLGGQVNSGPMSYSVNGKQYIDVAAGNALFAFALRQ